jgi:hypothetical protein
MTRCVADLPAPGEKIKRQVVHPTGEQYPFVGKKGCNIRERSKTSLRIGF